MIRTFYIYEDRVVVICHIKSPKRAFWFSRAENESLERLIAFHLHIPEDLDGLCQTLRKQNPLVPPTFDNVLVKHL
jgi:hypothetical protein